MLYPFVYLTLLFYSAQKVEAQRWPKPLSLGETLTANPITEKVFFSVEYNWWSSTFFKKVGPYLSVVLKPMTARG